MTTQTMIRRWTTLLVLTVVLVAVGAAVLSQIESQTMATAMVQTY